jgi:hypothetical protein
MKISVNVGSDTLSLVWLGFHFLQANEDPEHLCLFSHT